MLYSVLRVCDSQSLDRLRKHVVAVSSNVLLQYSAEESRPFLGG